MHLILLIACCGFAWGVRQWATVSEGSWHDRWHRALRRFLLSPLLLLTTALALVCMGPRGQMVHWREGWLSYGLGIGFLSLAIVLALGLLIEAGRAIAQIRHYPQIEVHGRISRLIDQATPFVAQIGFWQPELVISQGLLETLDAEHLEVVFVHEQAHHHYRDTFWFFWLGWLRRLTHWLPQTETLWQELLILRELRADRWAAQQVDHLLLAEALLSVVSAPQSQSETFCAAFSSAVVRDRLHQRIDALLEASEPPSEEQGRSWLWLLVVLVPIAIIPFHS